MRISDWSSDVCSSDLPGGLVLGSASIGDNVTIFQNVTLGARHFDGGYNLSRRPVLHARVTVGAGAVILGPVTIGEGATVAANSLVLADVPPGYTAMRSEEHTSELQSIMRISYAVFCLKKNNSKTKTRNIDRQH